MATAPAPETPSIASVIRDVWTQNEGNMPEAASDLFSRVIGDQALLNDILPAVLMAWCREQISTHVGAIRIAAVQAAGANDADHSPRIRRVIAATLFDFPLPGGKRLGDANANEIRDGAQSYDRAGRDALHKARWLQRVADKVGRKNKAESALTLAQLEQLFEESRNEA